ncbi:MAG: hypothetical protein GY801_46295 [bacterium]|nr:hypothetical protein [bacterium]
MSQDKNMDSAPLRLQLIAEVVSFVAKAQTIPGIIRIALVGSLTTNKPNPKDIDLLVTVLDEADLAPLATLGRKLQGHAMSFRSGGEVFLANPQGQHIGRICPWKVCKPGVRLRCDALHCGRRPYLHDDLKSIRLSEELIATPPIELWPRIVHKISVPSDIEEYLILPLSRNK